MVVFGQKLLNSGKVVSFGQGGCSRAKVHVFVQKYFYLGKVVLFGQNLFNSGKSGCFRAKVVVFPQRWLNSGNVVVFGKNILYSGKVGVFGQGRCNREKWMCLGKSGYNMGKSGILRAKEFVFGQKWL